MEFSVAGPRAFKRRPEVGPAAEENGFAGARIDSIETSRPIGSLPRGHNGRAVIHPRGPVREHYIDRQFADLARLQIVDRQRRVGCSLARVKYQLMAIIGPIGIGIEADEPLRYTARRGYGLSIRD